MPGFTEFAMTPAFPPEDTLREQVKQQNYKVESLISAHLFPVACVLAL